MIPGNGGKDKKKERFLREVAGNAFYCVLFGKKEAPASQRVEKGSGELCKVMK